MTAWEYKHTLAHAGHTYAHTIPRLPPAPSLQQSWAMIDSQHCLTGMKQEHNLCIELDSVAIRKMSLVVGWF